MGARIDGIDLSHWQNSGMDFAAAKKAGVKFVFHKATDGGSYKDPNYSRRRSEVKAAGLVFGAYHFAQPGDAAAQAKHFLATADLTFGDVAALDLEVKALGEMSVAARTAWVRTWVSVVEAGLGAKPLIYTPFDLASHFGCPLWVARYSNAMSAPRIPAPWKAYAIWQFSDGVYGSPKSVPGIGACDINTLQSGVSVNDLAITKPKPPKHSRGPNIDAAVHYLQLAKAANKASSFRGICVRIAERALFRIPFEK